MAIKYLNKFSFINSAAFCAVIIAVQGQGAIAQQYDGTVSAIGSAVTAMPQDMTQMPPVQVDDESQFATENAPNVIMPALPPATMDNITPSQPTYIPAQPAQSLEPVTSVIGLPEGAEGTLQGTNVMGAGDVESGHSGKYYRSDAIVPNHDLSAAGVTGPRKVDPAREPGQKYIIVEKGADASSYEAQYTAANRALKLGRYAAAMELFENLYKKNHKDPRILMGLAVSQQGAGFSESAARTYEDLLQVQPNNADAIVNLMGLMRHQYPSITLRKLMDLRQKYPTNVGIPVQIALTNADIGNYEDALRYLEIAASMEPRNSSHIYNMAIIMDRSGISPAKTIELYERALQLDASYGSAATELPREQVYDRLVVLRRRV